MAVALVLSFPFRFPPAGGPAVTVDDSTEDFIAEQIAILATTRPGERQLVPDFGMPDPAFTGGFDQAMLEAALTEWGTPAQITSVSSVPRDDMVSDVTVGFALSVESADAIA